MIFQIPLRLISIDLMTLLFFAFVNQQHTFRDTKINELKEQLVNALDVNEIKRIAAEITNVSTWSPMFKEEKAEGGEPILNLVFNESRPNVSIQITKNGYVEIPEEKANELKIPKQIPTHIFRNYTIIKDGILNIKVLPVMLDETTFNKLNSWIICITINESSK